MVYNTTNLWWKGSVGALNFLRWMSTATFKNKNKKIVKTSYLYRVISNYCSLNVGDNLQKWIIAKKTCDYKAEDCLN